jgi:hypothetical protein
MQDRRFDMNGSTNVQVVGFAAGLATLIMWLIGHYQPELMADAPVGAEAAITGVVSVFIGLILKPNAGIKKLPGTGAQP